MNNATTKLTTKDVLNRIILLRNYFGLTQKDFAELIHVSHRSYQRFESGDRVPDLDEILNIANSLSLNPNFFLASTDEFKPSPEDLTDLNLMNPFEDWDFSQKVIKELKLFKSMDLEEPEDHISEISIEAFHFSDEHKKRLGIKKEKYLHKETLKNKELSLLVWESAFREVDKNNNRFYLVQVMLSLKNRSINLLAIARVHKFSFTSPLAKCLCFNLPGDCYISRDYYNEITVLLSRELNAQFEALPFVC